MQIKSLVWATVAHPADVTVKVTIAYVGEKTYSIKHNDDDTYVYMNNVYQSLYDAQHAANTKYLIDAERVRGMYFTETSPVCDLPRTQPYRVRPDKLINTVKPRLGSSVRDGYTLQMTLVKQLINISLTGVMLGGEGYNMTNEVQAVEAIIAQSNDTLSMLRNNS